MHITLLVLLSVLLWPPAKRVNVALLYEKITKDRPRITYTRPDEGLLYSLYARLCVSSSERPADGYTASVLYENKDHSIKRLLVYSTLMVLLIRATALSGIQHLTL